MHVVLSMDHASALIEQVIKRSEKSFPWGFNVLE